MIVLLLQELSRWETKITPNPLYVVPKLRHSKERKVKGYLNKSSFGNTFHCYRPETKFANVMFLQGLSVHTGGVWLLPGGVCVCSGGVCGSSGGMHGCSWMVCVVALGGHMWFLRGAYIVALVGHAWLLWGACVVAPGGVHGSSEGACMVPLGGRAWDMTRYEDTVNEQVVRILLECILVYDGHSKTFW